MESLWDLVKPRGDNPRVDDLDFNEFSRLTAPRQAEWFDRRIATLLGEASRLASMLRMHLLGLDLHPRESIQTNPLLELIADIILELASIRGIKGVDLITTNVDCAIEQNIAWATQRARLGIRPSLIVRTAQEHTATWQAGAALGPKVRIWKIHGCLGALKSRLQSIWPDFKPKFFSK